MVLKYTSDIATLHRIDVDGCRVVEVFGDPNNASYEFRIIRDGVIEHHSDDGYGMPAVALRDGINWALGDD